jgi:hypothetical protein
MTLQKFELHEYCLQGYHIVEKSLDGAKYFWRKYFVPRGTDAVFYTHGKAEVRGDALYLYGYDGLAKDRIFKTSKKVNACLQSLEKWTKTEYFTRDNDPLQILLNCKTGKAK